MKFKHNWKFISLLVCAGFINFQGITQTQPVSRDEREKKKLTQPSRDTARLTDKLQVKKGYYPAGIKLDKNGYLDIEIKNNGGREIPRFAKCKITFGIVQLRTSPVKFLKCIQFKWAKKCWDWETPKEYIDYGWGVKKTPTGTWLTVRPPLVEMTGTAEVGYIKIPEELGANWGYYLNGLPEADKKDMRLGAKIEVEGAIKDLITVLPEGFLTYSGVIDVTKIEAVKYGVLKILIENKSIKGIIPKGLEVKANFVLLAGMAPDWRTVECLPDGVYGKIRSAGTCYTEAKGTLTAPIGPGESRWVIINYAAWGDGFDRFKRIIDDFPNIYPDPKKRPIGMGVRILIEGAGKLFYGMPAHQFWIKP